MAIKRRGRNHHEDVNRWIVSYADFITLLLAMFIALYAMSSVDAQRYQQAMQSILQALKIRPSSLSAIPLPSAPQTAPGVIPSPIAPLAPGVSALEQAATEIEKALGGLMEEGYVEVRRGPGRIEVELKTEILFPSGSAELRPQAVTPLEEVAKTLVGLPNPVRVEGHTDNVPIRTVVFPSNWELSCGRASRVVRFFEEHGVDPKRLASVGYGQWQPRSSNDTPQGKQQNRRVVVTILGTGDEGVRGLPEVTPPPASPLTPKPG